MNNKQYQTLQDIFENPVRSNIVWKDIESLLRACGAQLSEGSGSRIRIGLNGVRAISHRPHPKPNTDKGAIISMRTFLMEAGVTP